MKHNRKLSLFSIAMMFTFILTACGAPVPNEKASVFPGTQDADMVTLNIVSEPMDLNPMRINDAIAQGVLAHCMSGFTRLNEQDVAVADLAERWEISEDSTVYTMHLKQDAVWSNGDRVTAHDFYDSWVLQMTPSTGTIFASYLYDNIKNGAAFYQGEVDASQLGLTVQDDFTLIIEWSHPMAEAKVLFYLAQPFYLPINRKAYEQIGDEQYAKEAGQMVTNGAYQITEWVHDDHIILEKSDSYYDAAEIHIPKINLAMIGDANASLNSFTTGMLDLSNLYSEQIAQVAEKDQNAVRSYVDGGTWYLNFNMLDETLSNANLRKALTNAIDVQSLLDYVINDGSIAADGLVPDVIAGVGGESYAKARGSLFTGSIETAEGYLNQALSDLGKTKEELDLVLWASDTTYNQNQAAYLQQQWKKNLGLDVELKVMPANALLEAQYNGEHSMLVDGWGPTENDAVTFLENYKSDNLNNTTGYSNPAYDALLTQAGQERDPVERQNLLMQAERILIDDMIIGPLYFTCTTYAVSDKLIGIVRTPFQPFNLRGASIAAQ